MYTNGLNPKIQNLYPKVTFPVGRGTPTMHSLPLWDYNTQWKAKMCSSSFVSYKYYIMTFTFMVLNVQKIISHISIALYYTFAVGTKYICVQYFYSSIIVL